MATMDNLPIKTAKFGGYDRYSTQVYIQQLQEEHEAELQNALRGVQDDSVLNSQLESAGKQIEALKLKVNELEAENETLRNKVSSLEHVDVLGNKERDLLRQVDDLRQLSNDQQDALKRATDSANARNQEIYAYEQRIEELKAERDGVRKDAESYQQICTQLGQIEVEMRVRLAQMEQETQRSNEAKIAQTQDQCETMVKNAQNESDQLRDAASVELSTLRSDVASAAKNTDLDIDTALNSLNDAVQILSALRGSMNTSINNFEQIKFENLKTRDEEDTIPKPVSVPTSEPISYPTEDIEPETIDSNVVSDTEDTEVNETFDNGAKPDIEDGADIEAENLADKAVETLAETEGNNTEQRIDPDIVAGDRNNETIPTATSERIYNNISKQETPEDKQMDVDVTHESDHANALNHSPFTSPFTKVKDAVTDTKVDVEAKVEQVVEDSADAVNSIDAPELPDINADEAERIASDGIEDVVDATTQPSGKPGFIERVVNKVDQVGNDVSEFLTGTDEKTTDSSQSEDTIAKSSTKLGRRRTAKKK